MAETLALAIGVPAALGAAWLASRRSWSPAYQDNRGIALQTVIVIVVMLVIAGGVAGVLLSRADQVQSDLAAVNTGIDPTDSFELCQSVGRILTNNAALAAGTAATTAGTDGIQFVPGAAVGAAGCVVAAPVGDFSSSDCTSRGGTANAAITQCTFNVA